MPARTSRATMSRQWELLKCLPNSGSGKTVETITNALKDLGFSVSRRQTQRDLQELSIGFPITCNDQSKPHGWRWAQGASLNLPGISVADALSLHIVESSLRALLPGSLLHSLEPRFHQAAQTLKALADTDNTLAQWPRKIRSVPATLALQPSHIDSAVLEAVQDSLLQSRQITARYHPMNKEAADYTLHPLGLVQRGAVMYLVATAFEYPDIRLYALHRLLSASTTGEPAATPSGFDLGHYINTGALNFGTGHCFQTELLLHDDHLKRVLQETPLAADMQITPAANGALQVTATVDDTWELRRWLLSHGSGIEVLNPPALRQEIKEKLHAASQRYA